MKLRIATRKSLLALTQTRWVASKIREAHPDVEIEELHVVTEGDRVLDRPLSEIGGKGLFVSEVEATLADGRADIAVHSIKDVPSELVDGLEMICIPKREDPRDVLVTKDGEELFGLRAGSRIGTSSLRRSAQLKAQRPDLDFRAIRGNVDTRLRKLDEGKYDGIILAMAGLKRLELASRPLWIIPEELCLPAVGQGALGIEGRSDDERTKQLLAHLDDAHTHAAVAAERAMLHRLEGSCKVPVAGYARWAEGDRLTLKGMVGSLDGTEILSGASDCYLNLRNESVRRSESETLGLEVADGLLSKGAAKLIRDAILTVERQKVQGN